MKRSPLEDGRESELHVLDDLAPWARINLRWLVKLWGHGVRGGAAFDL